MSGLLNFKTLTDPRAIGSILAESILHELNQNKKVLFLVPGGSSISVACEAAKIIAQHPHNNLTVTLTDERYGKPNHKDSNWLQLSEQGFSLPQAKIYHILTGDDPASTTRKFNEFLEVKLTEADYKIGLFGVGKDGHTAGILPETDAVNYSDKAFTYKTETFERITISPKVIEILDEAVVYMKGSDKWPIIKNLEKDIDPYINPVQFLKKVPLLTIFSDYQKI